MKMCKCTLRGLRNKTGYMCCFIRLFHFFFVWRIAKNIEYDMGHTDIRFMLLFGMGISHSMFAFFWVLFIFCFGFIMFWIWLRAMEFLLFSSRVKLFTILEQHIDHSSFCFFFSFFSSSRNFCRERELWVTNVSGITTKKQHDEYQQFLFCIFLATIWPAGS